MATSPPPSSFHINLWAILSESKHIIRARSRHFLSLSVLFLLPLSFSLSIYPAFINQLFFQSTIKIQFSFIFIFTLLFILFIFIFSLLATGSITYSVFDGFYGRPVKLISTIKSTFTSFFRLFSTWLLTELIVFGMLLILGLILFSLVKTTQVLGYVQVNFFSPYFAALCLVFLIILISVVVYLKVIWIFACVIAVVESSRGLEPLKRSKNLVRGMKGVAFKMFLFYLFIDGILTWFSVAAGWNGRRPATFFIHIVISSTLFMVLVLSKLAANTVFYMYSKAKHGELEGEIAVEFAGEYAHNYEKVPQVVSNV